MLGQVSDKHRGATVQTPINMFNQNLLHSCELIIALDGGNSLT